MTIVSSKEFAIDMNIYHDADVYEEVLEPDDDLREAITGKELLEMLHEDIHQMFSKKKKNERVVYTEGA